MVLLYESIKIRPHSYKTVSMKMWGECSFCSNFNSDTIDYTKSSGGAREKERERERKREREREREREK